MDNMILPHPDLDFFRSNHRPYYIVTAEWTQQSAGTRVTFQLCHALNELGYEAYVVAQKSALHLRTPLLTPDIIARHKAQGREAVGVYTELMWGNTLETDIVVKWMTNREGMYSYSKHDDEALYFYFSPKYAIENNVNFLSIPPVDRTIFNDDGVDDSEREGFAYYAYKYLKEGKGTISDKLTAKGISLCKDIPRTQREIADILRKVKVLYTYEDTALNGEAGLCGCIPIAVKTNFTKDFEKHNEPGDIFLTEDEIDTDADIIMPYNLTERYEHNFIGSYNQLVDFVNMTQQTAQRYTKKDPLLTYCHGHEKIFIYGSGIVGGMVFNALRVTGIYVEGFIISDDQYELVKKDYCGVPVYSLSCILNNYNENCGVILAMTSGNQEQVIPKLNALNIKYFC